MIAGGGPHSRNSQNSFNVKKGINKIDYSILQSKQYAKLVRNTFNLYIADKKGNKPTNIALPSSAEEHQSWKKSYEATQNANWKEYALTTFKQNCANCHAIDTNAVGPALKGLFGKKQTVISSDGSKKEVTVDLDYIKASITDPTSVYPEGFQPIMPKIPLSDKEVDVLTRWIETLK